MNAICPIEAIVDEQLVLWYGPWRQLQILGKHLVYVEVNIDVHFMTLSVLADLCTYHWFWPMANWKFTSSKLGMVVANFERLDYVVIRILVLSLRLQCKLSSDDGCIQLNISTAGMATS